jgi:hypothetical protein
MVERAATAILLVLALAACETTFTLSDLRFDDTPFRGGSGGEAPPGGAGGTGGSAGMGGDGGGGTSTTTTGTGGLADVQSHATPVNFDDTFDVVSESIARWDFDKPERFEFVPGFVRLVPQSSDSWSATEPVKAPFARVSIDGGQRFGALIIVSLPIPVPHGAGVAITMRRADPHFLTLFAYTGMNTIPEPVLKGDYWIDPGGQPDMPPLGQWGTSSWATPITFAVCGEADYVQAFYRDGLTGDLKDAPMVALGDDPFIGARDFELGFSVFRGPAGTTSIRVQEVRVRSGYGEGECPGILDEPVE